MKNTKRILLAAVAALLLVAVSVGGTLAWLVDNTAPVTNTFTAAGIDIDLTETKDADGNWTMQLIPGTTKTKDPVVKVIRTHVDEETGATVQGTDVDIYLFVKFVDTMAGTCLTYESNLNVANGWTKLEGVEGVDDVWYRVVPATEENPVYHLLKDDIVSVEDTVEKTATNVSGSMTYTAYAIQTEGFSSVTDAWAQVSGT